MSLKSEIIIDVIENFNYLNEKLRILCHQIEVVDKYLPSWFSQPKELACYDDSTSNRSQAAFFLRQLEYIDEQPPKEILLGPGWLACSLETLAAVDTLNLAKQRFKLSMLKLKDYKPSKDELGQINNELNKRPSLIASNLNKFGLARLHLKQCYRLLPTLHQQPHKISWTWANTKAITKISKEQALMMLEKKSKSSEILFQISKLYNLSHNEPLAIVQTLSPHLRANIVFKTQSEDDLERKMIKGAMPICFPYDTQENMPSFNPPKEKQGLNPERSVRSDVKLETEVFLPAIRAFRYKKQKELVC